ncbi:hypothetical protein OSTOST_22273 [Ostertagia ostertagi]
MSPKILLVCLCIASATPADAAFELFFKFRPSENCAAAQQDNGTSLAVVMWYVCTFNKTSRLKEETWLLNNQNTISGSARMKFKHQEHKDFEFGLYVLVLRQGLVRRNENHPTNPRIIKPNLLFNRTWTYAAQSGQGSDFAKMYYLAPFAARIEFTVMRQTGQTGTPTVYDLRSCADTGKFIANEGYYQLHLESGEWWPTYYDPVNSKLYY